MQQLRGDRPNPAETSSDAQKHRQAAYSEYLKERHPKLYEHEQRRSAYWRELRRDRPKEAGRKQLTQLLGEWDKLNPSPVSWGEQAKIQAEFAQAYVPPDHPCAP